MFRFIIFASILSLISMQGISADRILGTPGVISEFSEVEELVKNRKLSREYRKQTLERNLVNAVRFTFMRRYADSKDKVKDLTVANLAFEQQKGTFNYFIKYKDHFLYYSFAVDPEVYVQVPSEEKLYIKSAELSEDAPPAKDSAPK